MKRVLLLMVLVLLTLDETGMLEIAQAAATDSAVESLFPQQKAVKPHSELEKSGNRPSSSADPLIAIAKRLDIIESRLGPANRQPTPATTIERRLADIEQRLDRLELQFNRIQQMEQRIRKIEAQRY